MPTRPRPSVSAVVWTHDRPAVLAQCLKAIEQQTYGVRNVIVVESPGRQASWPAIAEQFPSVSFFSLAANLGIGAAIGKGVERAISEPPPPDLVWLVEDDALPAPQSLEVLVRAMERHPGVGVVGPVGAYVTNGSWQWSFHTTNDADVDFCMTDGSLMRREVLQHHGCPRDDLFIVHVDVEHGLRLHRAGVKSRQVPDTGYEQRKLGTAVHSDWRAYYETRNYLLIARQFAAADLWVGALRRLARDIWRDHRRDRRLHSRIRLRARGILDGCLGRSGRRVEPT